MEHLTEITADAKTFTVNESSAWKIFDNPEFGKLSCYEMNDEGWFIAKEVADILGYGNGRDALRKHVDEEDKKRLTYKEIQTSRFATSDKVNNNGMTIINESGLYSLILSSKLPSAKEFKRWVTSEVIPTIRKHGLYVSDELLYSPEFLERALVQLKEEREKNKRLETEIEENVPKVVFADRVCGSEDTINMETMAKLLTDKGFKIGRNNLLKFLREQKILMRNNVPYQVYIDKGYFKLAEKFMDNSNKTKLLHSTLVTGKGQMWLLKRLLKTQPVGAGHYAKV